MLCVLAINNNLIVQWGYKDNYQTAFTFPLAFSNTTYTIIPSCKNLNSAANWPTPINCTKTSFNIYYAQAGSVYIPINYVAIGI